MLSCRLIRGVVQKTPVFLSSNVERHGETKARQGHGVARLHLAILRLVDGAGAVDALPVLVRVGVVEQAAEGGTIGLRQRIFANDDR